MHWVALLVTLVTLVRSEEDHCDKDGCFNLNVKTKSGPVRGHIPDQVTKTVAFYGIPFAQPPVNKLRFKPPLPIAPWTQVFEASKAPLLCVQAKLLMSSEIALPEMETDEDCLKLNIWVPQGVPKDAAVMVFIHGGAFLVGSPLDALTNGDKLASNEKVIVVSLAYRLGALGFLYLGNEDAPGNVGLLDQQLALKWIKNNIAAFGGCPDKITIFGVSAGGASVGFHLLSEGSKGLFNKGILISGSPANPWAYREPEVALDTARYVAERLGFKGDLNDKAALFDFLLYKDAEDMAEVKFPDGLGALSETYFGPTIDGTFIKDSPVKLIEQGQFGSQVDVILGSTSDEAVFFLGTNYPEMANKKDALVMSKEDHLQVIKEMSLKNLDDLETLVVSHWYVNWTSPDCPEMLRDTALAAVGDTLFVCDIETLTESYSKTGNKVFRYVMDEVVYPLFPSWSGGFHASEIFMIMAPGIDFSQKLQDFNSQLMRRYANFARTSDPSNMDGESDWPVYLPGKREYLILRASANAIGQHYRARECALWYKLMPHFRK